MLCRWLWALMGVCPMNEIMKKIKKCLESTCSYFKNKSDNNHKFLMWSITFFLFVLIVIIGIPPDASIFMYIAGKTPKLELLKFIGWGISGTIAIFGVMGLLQRAAALDQQNEMTKEVHIQERFNVATEHLGHASMSVRIAAFSAFCHLVEIKPDWRKNIFDILCAHLRQTTRNKNYQQDVAKFDKIKPTVEVHNLLDILFNPENKDGFIFGKLHVNLRGANLQGASLQGTNLNNADLYNANLQKSYLKKINLQKAYLYRAKLQKANLQEANLQKARMWRAKLQKANLQKANLQKANLRRANLQKADLR